MTEMQKAHRARSFEQLEIELDKADKQGSDYGYYSLLALATALAEIIRKDMK